MQSLYEQMWSKFAQMNSFLMRVKPTNHIDKFRIIQKTHYADLVVVSANAVCHFFSSLIHSNKESQ